MIDVEFTTEQLIADITRQSFFEFVQEFWGEIIPEDLILNWHIEYLCAELQVIAERVFQNKPKKYDLIINISPGSTKSTIASIMFPAWIWTRMPSARIIGGSYAHSLSMDLSRKNRNVVISDKYHQCFPEISLKSDQNTKSHFENTDGGMRYSVGVGGSVTGMHGHVIVVDDPIDPNEAVSEAKLKAANRWSDETLPTRKVNKAVTPTILIMQRLHQNDPTNKMFETYDNVRHICIPAELTDRVNPLKLKKYYKDGLFDPIRLPMNVLNEYKKKGEFQYAGQFLQWPVPLGGGMFKTDLIEITNQAPSCINKVRYWDKAGTKDDGAYTAGVLMGVDERGKYWILDVVRGQWDSAKRESIIKQTAKIDGKDIPIGIEQEPGSGGKESAENTIRNLAGWKAYADRPTGDKVQRADPYSSQVNSGNVGIVKGEWTADYLNELQFFPHSKYKDQVDASSGAFNRLTNRRAAGGFFGLRKKGKI